MPYLNEAFMQVKDLLLLLNKCNPDSAVYSVAYGSTLSTNKWSEVVYLEQIVLKHTDAQAEIIVVLARSVT